MEHQLYRYAAMIPIGEKDSTEPPHYHPMVTLAHNKEEAFELARNAGLLIVGQLNEDGRVVPPIK